MPDVIIKDMEMPKCCGDCYVGFTKQIGCDLAIGFDGYKEQRHPDCPLRPAPEWISVEERLPKDETDCLIAVKGSLSQPICVRTGFYDQTHKCWCQHEEMWAYRPFQFGGSYHVTHWMPLPEPPKEEI